MGKAFWLGIIGAIFGVLGALAAVMIQIINESLANPVSGSSLYVNAAGAIIFSIVGIAGGVLEKRKIIGAALMIIGAFGVVISLSIFGALTFILFLVGGIIILTQKKEQAAGQATTGQNTG